MKAKDRKEWYCAEKQLEKMLSEELAKSIDAEIIKSLKGFYGIEDLIKRIRACKKTI